MTVQRVSTELLQRMAQEFYGVQLSEGQLAQLRARLEAWLRDLGCVKAETLEPEEPITVVYVGGAADADQRG